MPTLTLFDEFLGDVGKGVHQLHAHSFRAILTNTAPNKATNAVKADITEIAAGNGYSANGIALTGVAWAETGAGSGIWRFTFNDPSWIASGGPIATHQYLVVYNDTPTSPADPLVGYVDRGSSDVISDGNTRTWDIQANGAFELDGSP